MSAAKRPKLSEPTFDPPMSELLAATDDYICRYNQPPPGVKATWRELDEDESDGIDADSTSSEEEIDCSEHFHKLALSQYDRLIENDPTNSKLIQRRKDLIEAKQRDEALNKHEPKMDVDLP